MRFTTPKLGKDGGPAGAPMAALAALGIVFGDLGTSPLYTLQTVVEAVGGHFTPDGALGILSLIVWTLIITISVKYCLFVMRADNHGEGGILALMSLLGANRFAGGAKALAVMGLLGAALIYGDGIITPAISVLSALEGVNVVTKALCDAGGGADPVRLVCAPAVRHGQDWRRLRTDHARLVRDHLTAWPERHSA